MVFRDLRKRLAAPELGAELRLRQPKIARRSVQAGERTEVAEAMVESAAEQWEVTALNPLLELVAFRLSQTTRSDGGVDPIGERLLESIAELGGRDTELRSRVVDHGLALLSRRVALRGADRNAAPCGGKKGHGAEDEVPSVQLHG